MQKELNLPLLNNKRWTINSGKILFCESDQHLTKVFYLNQNESINSKYVNLGIGNLQEILIEFPFYRCHKKCLVNMEKVEPYGEYPKLQLKLIAEIFVPLSKRRRQEFHNAYLSRAKENKL